MAVGHVASASSGSQASVSSFNIGTLGTGARAGIVFVCIHNSSTDIITGVTWNGVSMSRLYYAADTNTEPGFVVAYFLDNVTNGTITVSRTNNATVTVGYAASISAGTGRFLEVANTVTVGGAGTTNTNANTSESGTAASDEKNVDDGSPGTNSLRYAAYYSGASTPPSAGTNSTALQVLDSSLYGSRFVRETTAGQGSRPVGSATGTTDDWAFVAVAVREGFTTVPGSFTANAVIRKTAESSFTADAIQFKTQTAVFYIGNNDGTGGAVIVVPVTTITGSNYQRAVLGDSPVVVFAMDEASGNLTDLVASKSGVVSGSPEYGVTGPIPHHTAVDISANTQYFTVADHADLDLDGSDATFEFWYARDTDAGVWQGIICKTGSYGVSVNSNDYMALIKPGTGMFFNGSAGVPANGSWHHYVLQRKDAAAGTGDHRLFVDGVEQTIGDQVYGYDIDDNNNSLLIGQDPESPIYPALGKIAYVAIYKSFLTPAQIANHYGSRNGFTVNAVAKKTFEPSFTANAIILKTQTSGTSYYSTVLADSPVGYWRLGESSGYPQDSSGNGHHVTASSGSPTYGVTGALTNDSNKAIIFYRTTTYFTVPAADISLGDGPFSVEFWAKRADLNSSTFYWVWGNRPGSGTPGWYTGFNAAGNFTARDNELGAWFTSSETFEDTDWHHFVITKNGSTRTAYANGSALTNTASNVTVEDYLDWGIGAAGATTSNSFDGTVDELAVYTTVLSSTRVTAHYTAGTTGGGGPTIDAFIVKTIEVTTTKADAVIKKTLEPTFAANAVILRTWGGGDKYAGLVLAHNPLAYWRLGEPSGTTADDELGNAPLAYQGTPTLGTTGLLVGDADTAVSFDASVPEWAEQTAATYMPAGGSAGAAIEGWVNLDVLPTGGGAVAIACWGFAYTGDGYHLLLIGENSGNRFASWNFRDQDSQEGAYSDYYTFATGTTYYIVASHDYAAETVSFYINGSLVSTEDVSAASTPKSPLADEGFSIAAYNYGASYKFDGVIDEVVVYGQPATLAQITARHSTGIGFSAAFTVDARIVKTIEVTTTKADAVILATITPAGGTKADATLLANSGTKTFAADAIVQRTFEPTFAADAIVQRTFEPTFAADAVLAATIPGSFSANAVIAATIPGDFAADAINLKTQGLSFLIGDAVDPGGAVIVAGAVTVPGSFTADAIVLATVTPAGGFAASAILLAPRPSATTADAIILATPTQTPWTVDAVVLKASGASFAANAVVQGSIPSSFSSNATILSPQTGSFSVASITAKSAADSFLLDSAILSTPIFAASISAIVIRTVDSFLHADSVVLKPTVTSFGVEAVVRRTASVAAEIDAVIHRPMAASLTTDAIVSRAGAGSFVADAVARRTESRVATLDAVLLAPRGTSLTTDAIIAWVVPGSTTADAVIGWTQPGSLAADAIILAEISSSFVAGAWISGIFSLEAWLAGRFEVDAFVQSATSGYFSVEAWIAGPYYADFPVAAVVSSPAAGNFLVEAVVASTATASTTLDATIFATVHGSFAGDAVVSQTTSEMFLANAVIHRVGAGGLTTDAIIASTATGSLDLDAIIFGTISPAFAADAALLVTSASGTSADAVIAREQAGTAFALDAVLSVVQATTFDAQAIVVASRTGDTTVDAWIYGAGVGAFSSDAIVKGTASATITASAVVLATGTGSFTADALLKTVSQASFGIDSILGATRMVGFATDAVFLSPSTGSFELDAVIEPQLIGASFSLDSVLAATTGASFVAAAIVSREWSGSFAAASIIRSTPTSFFTIDAGIVGGAISTFTLDAQIFGVGQEAFVVDASISLHITQEIEATFSAATIAASLSATTLEATMSASTIAATYLFPSVGRGSFNLAAEVA